MPITQSYPDVSINFPSWNAMTSETAANDHNSLLQIGKRHAWILGSLENCYRSLRPEFADDFRQRVYERLRNQLQIDPARLLNADGQVENARFHEYVGELELASLPVEHGVWHIHAGCAYCILAELAYYPKGADRAWDLLTQAAIHNGWVLSMMLGPKVYDYAVLKAVKSNSGRKAAKGRHKETDAMKEAAYAFVKENGGFPSQPAAAFAIEDFLRTKFPNAKPLKGPEATIMRWLRDMPEREEYFDTLKKGRQ
jgi:hypothetical protein